MQTARHKRNAYAAASPTRLLLDGVADKWAVLILGLLGEGPVRFNQICRQIEGISQKGSNAFVHA
jgi:DNA-binding HxlR family transcriptional regulator